MSIEYEIIHRDSEVVLGLNGFGIAKVYFNTEHSLTPLSEEDATNIIEKIKDIVEVMHPASSLDEDEYESSREAMDDLHFSKMMKLMMLKSMLE